MHPLVDAFWQGRNKLKKTTHAYFDNNKKPRAACALGAIYYGLYKKTNIGVNGLDPLNQDWPEISTHTGTDNLVEIPCEHTDADAVDGSMGDISAILIHLNDEHDGRSWPDKKIAEWLEKALGEVVKAQMPL